MYRAKSLVWSRLYPMGKIGRIVRTTTRKDFLLGFVGTFLAVLGVPSTVIGMLGGHLSVGLTIGLSFLALAVSAFVNRHKWATKLSVKVIMPGKKILRCPPDLNLTREAVRLARYEFGRDTISLSNYEPLRAKNPSILVCLIDAGGNFLGYFDVMPLKTNFAELFLQGRVSEKDITHEDILSTQEMRQCRYVYIAGLAVSDAEYQASQVNAVILVWGLLKYLDHFYGASKAYVFASAANGDGENLLQSFKIPVVCGADIRADKHKLYGLTLTRDQLADLIACVPDYSLLCSIDWASGKDGRNDKLPIPRRPSFPQKKRRSLSAYR
jgi:hypothetical protein